MSSTGTTSAPRGAWVLALGMVVAGVIGAAGSVLLWTPVWPGLAALAFVAAFALADRFPAYYEFRDQSVAVSLTEAVLTAGFFILEPFELLVARVVGGLVVSHLLDRTSALKRAFNTGLVLLEALVSVGLFVALGGTPDPTSPRTWLAVLVALVAMTLLDAAALRTVIRLATGERGGVDRWATAMMLLAATVSASTILAGAILVGVSTQALLLLLGPTVVLLVGHRAHIKVVQEIKRIRGMYALATRLSQAPELDVVLLDLMTEARRTLRAHDAELLLLADQAGAEDLWMAVDRDGELHTTIAEGWMPPPAHAHALRQWSAGDQPDGVATGDELAIPIATREELFGSLVIRGRRPRAGSFGDDDLTVLAGVASQVATHVSASRLRHQLQTADDARRYLASHDVLTGLVNRRAFEKSLAALRPQRATDRVVVVALNLKRFRQVNDTMGNLAGDEVLTLVADRLRGVATQDALLCRVSGDEFLLAQASEDPASVAAAVRDAFVEPFLVAGRSLSFAVAIGYACRTDDHLDAPDPLYRADLALTVARSARSSAVVAYNDELEATVARRSRIAAKLPAAIGGGAITLHYQPVVDLHGERIVAVEALARWTDDELGSVSPAEFVSVAEETGAVNALTDLVMDQACGQLRRWCDDGLQLAMAVNVSAHDLERDDIAQLVWSTLDRHDLDPGQLVLEITETAVMTDREHSGSVLDALRRLGVGIAIDDFGIGQSSLAYLRDLPATKLKIDQSFVQDLNTLEGNRGIIKAIVDLAGSRGLEIVAEGIEDRAVFDALRDMGVHYGQGYFMSRPLHAYDMFAILRSVESMGFPTINA